ncbi:acetyl-CoA carboxylase biotin carboxyl carrier protein [Plantactinospora sp. ZYX-F-223]|uniref:acetyl-CoA carboxylase biotin carboxyl carrier protein n=1 Tax=Plantactinospora sp. ZYX-F-223 TaxID=3144103 RepID=UPI0031FC242A
MPGPDVPDSRPVRPDAPDGARDRGDATGQSDRGTEPPVPADRRAEPAVPADRGTELAELRRQAGRLLAETAGPVRRIHLRSGDTVLEIEWSGVPGSPGPADAPGHAPADAATRTASPTGVDGIADGDSRRTVVAPMVGTCYRAAEPGGAPFVEVGDKVEPGQVVCIVEAMKLMNEVVADQAGRVAEVLVRDGEPVEFGQPLIALLPA